MYDGANSLAREVILPRLSPGNPVGDDFRVHLETRNGLPRFGAVVAVDSNAMPKDAERPLKTADRANVRPALSSS